MQREKQMVFLWKSMPTRARMPLYTFTHFRNSAKLLFSSLHFRFLLCFQNYNRSCAARSVYIIKHRTERNSANSPPLSRPRSVRNGRYVAIFTAGGKDDPARARFSCFSVGASPSTAQSAEVRWYRRTGITKQYRTGVHARTIGPQPPRCYAIIYIINRRTAVIKLHKHVRRAAHTTNAMVSSRRRSAWSPATAAGGTRGHQRMRTSQRRPWLLATACVCALAIFGGRAAMAQRAGTGYREAPVVNIRRQGAMSGAEHTLNKIGYRAWTYLGIPFARPPTGDLRFAPPETDPPPAWDGVRNGSAHMPACIQLLPVQPHPVHRLFANVAIPPIGQIKTSEDCLYLNIYRPEGKLHNIIPIYHMGIPFLFAGYIHNPYAIYIYNMYLIT